MSPKTWFLTIILVLPVSVFCQVIWLEDFTGLADGSTLDVGATAWTTTYAGGGGFSKQSFGGLEYFNVNNTGTEGVWMSESIDISAFGYAIIDVTTVALFNGAGDYIRGFYKINGAGPEIQFFEVLGGFVSATTEGSAIVTGSSVEVIIRASNDGSFFGLDTYTFDDVTVTGVTTLYSRKTGNWNDATVGNATWSTVALGGVSCDCTPNSSTRTIVGNGHVVSITAAATTTDLQIQTGSTVNFTATFDLNILRGGTLDIQTGATLNSGAFTGAQLDFDDPHTHLMDIDGSLTVGDIDINDDATITISGGGTISIQDDILIGGTAAITNNLTSTFSIGDDLEFEAGVTNASFTNNQTITETDDLSFQNDNNTFTNNGTYTFNEILAGAGDNGCVLNNTGTLTFFAVNTNDANQTITNSGTINQSGNFINGEIDTGSSYTNAANATWNWTYVFGAVPDPQITSVLNCSAANNTFNYAAAGNQTVQAITYHHLGIETSGTKALGGAIDVNGNLNISGTTIFDLATPTAFNVTLAGNWTVTSANADPFRQRTGTITFDGGADQTISNGVTAGGETFFNLTVSKAGGNLILDTGNGTDVLITGALNLTNGKVLTSTTEMLTVDNAATSSAGNINSFVDGPMRKTGNSPDPFVFPLGDGTIWARLGVDYGAGAGTTTQFESQYFDAAHPDLSNDGTFNNVSGKEYWVLDRLVTAAQATVQLFWEDGARSEIDDVTCCDLIVAQYTGSDWTDVGRTALTGTIPSGTVTSATVSSFSPFTFGSEGHPNNPLPVELLYFRAVPVDDEIELTWATASELNNDFFTIEKSLDGEEFSAVETVEGKGNSQTLSEYKDYDYGPYPGISYYRLKQTDFDGQFSYSSIVQVEIKVSALWRAYPNPSDGLRLQIRLTMDESNEAARVQVVDLNGKTVNLLNTQVSDGGEINEELTKPLVSGTYIVSVSVGQKLKRLKIVVR